MKVLLEEFWGKYQYVILRKMYVPFLLHVTVTMAFLWNTLAYISEGGRGWSSELMVAFGAANLVSWCYQIFIETI